MSKKRGYLNEKFVDISLPSLYFPEPHDRAITNEITLTNISHATVAFKIKTTQPKRYTVKPRAGFITLGQTQEVKVTMHPLAEGDHLDRDKFLVESAIISESEQKEPKDTLWKQLEAAKEHRVAGNKLTCRFSGPTPEDVMMVVMNDGSAVVSSKGNTKAQGGYESEEDIASAGWMTSRGGHDDESGKQPAPQESPAHTQAHPQPEEAPVDRDFQTSPEVEDSGATDPAIQHAMEDIERNEHIQRDNFESMIREAEQKANRLLAENKELQNQIKSRESIISTLRTTVQSCEGKVAELDKKLKEKDKKIMGMRRKTASSRSSSKDVPQETMNIKLIVIVADRKSVV